MVFWYTETVKLFQTHMAAAAVMITVTDGYRVQRQQSVEGSAKHLEENVTAAATFTAAAAIAGVI